MKTKNNFYYAIAVICFCSQISTGVYGATLGDFFPKDLQTPETPIVVTETKKLETEQPFDKHINMDLSVSSPSFFPPESSSDEEKSPQIYGRCSPGQIILSSKLPEYAVKPNKRVGVLEPLTPVELTESEQLTTLYSAASLQTMNTVAQLLRRVNQPTSRIPGVFGKKTLQEKYDDLFDVSQALGNYAYAQCMAVEQLKQVVLQQNQQIAELRQRVEELVAEKTKAKSGGESTKHL